MKEKFTEAQGKKFIEERYDYHVAGIVNSLMDGNMDDVNANHTFREVVEMISNWIIKDVRDIVSGFPTEKFFKLFPKSVIESYVYNLLNKDNALKLFIKKGFINYFIVYEKEIEEKESELVILKLRLLKKKLMVNNDIDDVTFNDIQLMKDIVKLWDDSLKSIKVK